VVRHSACTRPAGEKRCFEAAIKALLAILDTEVINGVMAMLFYHDEASESIYAVDEIPIVRENKKKHRWHVSSQWDIVRADNYTIQGRWRFSVSEHPHDEYDSDRDDREAVISFFRMNNSPPGKRIDAASYLALKQCYEAKIAENERLRTVR
jgi:hypothetical protein